MNKLYNTQKEISTNIFNFLKLNFSFLRKTQLNIIPHIIFGMIFSNSCNASSIASVLKDDFSFVKLDSVSKRIRRFFNNNLFDPYLFYFSFIKFVISSYKLKHNDKRIHITFDHTYSHENYTIYFISLRVGKQGIPLYFECFKDINNPLSYFDDTIIKGINFIHDLFKDYDFDLIFLADRWFNSSKVLNHIDSLGHTYVVRLKSNIRIATFDSKEGHYIRKLTSDLDTYVHKAKYYPDTFIFESLSFKTNIVLSNSKNTSSPWILATNGDVTKAVKDYSYRFGSIESIFKHQKSNGFNLEKVNNSNLLSFTSMFSLLCFSITWLTLIGTDYSTHSTSYPNCRFETHKTRNGRLTRVVSLFKIGMTIMKRAFNSPVYIKIPYNFKLYDV